MYVALHLKVPMGMLNASARYNLTFPRYSDSRDSQPMLEPWPVAMVHIHLAVSTPTKISAATLPECGTSIKGITFVQVLAAGNAKT